MTPFKVAVSLGHGHGHGAHHPPDDDCVGTLCPCCGCCECCVEEAYHACPGCLDLFCKCPSGTNVVALQADEVGRGYPLRSAPRRGAPTTDGGSLDTEMTAIHVHVMQPC